MTHAELVERARIWLAKKHPVAVTEIGIVGEEPDAIGWQGKITTLIECKASRADFKSDASKPFRREPARGIGNYRYYMTPPGLVRVEELPERWGLLEVHGRGVRVIKKAGIFININRAHQEVILLSTIRRIGQLKPKGVSIRCYLHENKNRATLTADCLNPEPATPTV